MLGISHLLHIVQPFGQLSFNKSGAYLGVRHLIYRRIIITLCYNCKGTNFFHLSKTYQENFPTSLSLYWKPYGNLTKFLYLSCTSLKQKSSNSLIYNQLRIKALFVRAKGIEPIRLSAPDPKSGLSTNFNTPATIFHLSLKRTANVLHFF